MSVGTTPLSIHVVDTMAMNTSMGTAGRIWRALRRKPTTRPRRPSEPLMALRAMASMAEARSAQGLSAEMASAPTNTTTPINNARRVPTGSTDRANDGDLATLVARGIFFNFYLSYISSIGWAVCGRMPQTGGSKPVGNTICVNWMQNYE